MNAPPPGALSTISGLSSGGIAAVSGAPWGVTVALAVGFLVIGCGGSFVRDLVNARNDKRREDRLKILEDQARATATASEVLTYLADIQANRPSEPQTPDPPPTTPPPGAP